MIIVSIVKLCLKSEIMRTKRLQMAGTGILSFGKSGLTPATEIALVMIAKAKTPAYPIVNKSCFDAAMQHMHHIGKPCCNGLPSYRVPHYQSYNYIIVNHDSFQFWQDPTTLHLGGYEVRPFSDLFYVS